MLPLILYLIILDTSTKSAIINKCPIYFVNLANFIGEVYLDKWLPSKMSLSANKRGKKIIDLLAKVRKRIKR